MVYRGKNGIAVAMQNALFLYTYTVFLSIMILHITYWNFFDKYLTNKILINVNERRLQQRKIMQ